jgi:hypothetical protein
VQTTREHLFLIAQSVQRILRLLEASALSCPDTQAGNQSPTAQLAPPLRRIFAGSNESVRQPHHGSFSRAAPYLTIMNPAIEYQSQTGNRTAVSAFLLPSRRSLWSRFVFEQVGNRYIQRSGYFGDAFQRNIACATLDIRDISAVQFCHVGKFGLSHAKLLPVAFDRLTKPFFHIKQFSHAVGFRGLIYIYNRSRIANYCKDYVILQRTRSNKPAAGNVNGGCILT